MIHPHASLLRHAQDFFRSDLLGLYTWDQVKIANPELAPPIAPDISVRERREEQYKREGKYIGQARLIFGPWEILIYSPNEKPPLGEVQLRSSAIGGEVFVTGPLDAATWTVAGTCIRSECSLLHHRKASHG